MIKILNIHGYHGNPKNSAYQALEALGCEIIAPDLDYDNVSPENILGSLKYILADKRPDNIVEPPHIVRTAQKSPYGKLIKQRTGFVTQAESVLF